MKFTNVHFSSVSPRAHTNNCYIDRDQSISIFMICISELPTHDSTFVTTIVSHIYMTRWRG